MHDMLPYGAAWQDGPGTTWERIRIFVFLRRHNHHRVCTSIHTLWHLPFGVIGVGESIVGDICLCVLHDDGT